MNVSFINLNTLLNIKVASLNVTEPNSNLGGLL